jgi:hypothetical protein
MIRTQVLITPEQKIFLDLHAEKEQVSISTLVRRALELYLQTTQSEVNTTAQLLQRAKNAPSGAPADLSTNDEYLYGI